MEAAPARWTLVDDTRLRRRQWCGGLPKIDSTIKRGPDQRPWGNSAVGDDKDDAEAVNRGADHSHNRGDEGPERVRGRGRGALHWARLEGEED
ncbi:hypothetical protein ACLOJK_027955 [Asimina triloba]